MKIIDPGHKYLAEPIPCGSEPPVEIHFPKRQGPNYPGNIGEHPGPLTQEYLRAIIDRAKYMNRQGPCAETDIIIHSLRTALMAFEVPVPRYFHISADARRHRGRTDLPDLWPHTM